MLEVPVLNTAGQEVGKFHVDEALLGGRLRPALLKQAAVMYHANNRQGTVATKDRGEVEGSTKKLYSQKGTGNARRGSIRTSVMKGGGMAFGKRPREFRQTMPLQQRRLARNNAILAKILSNNLKILDTFTVQAPKTKEVAKILGALGAERSVLIAMDGADRNLYLSTRNIARTAIKPTAEVSAYDVMCKRTMIITKAAMESMLKSVTDKQLAKRGRAQVALQLTHRPQPLVVDEAISTTDSLRSMDSVVKLWDMMPRKAKLNAVILGQRARSFEPISQMSMTIRIQDRVLYLAAKDSAESCFAPLQKGLATEIFVDAEHRNLEEVVAQAIDVYKKVAPHFSLWEPVVVGPIPGTQPAVIRRLTRHNIRTTGFAFKEFMARVARNRAFQASIGQNKLDKKSSAM